MGIHQSSVYVGTVAGGTLGGYMGEHFGWRSSFSLLGVAGIVFGLVLLVFLKEPAGPSRLESRPRESLREVLRTVAELFRIPMVRILGVVFIGANFVAGIFLTWLPKFLHDKFDMSLSMAGFSATAYLQVASVLGVLAGGLLADRLVRRYRGGRMMAQTAGPVLRGALHLCGRLDVAGAVAHSGHVLLWPLQGGLRFQHLGVAA